MTAAIATVPKIDRREREPRESLRTGSVEIGRVRTELLRTFLEQINAAEIPYCVLNGFRGYPEVIASDVDFMVLPNDAEQVAPLLREVAQRCGAILVQGIRHETGACYFVLAKQVGREVAYLHPDCTTDYRRDGRLWLEADPVLRRRRRYKSFFIPAIADEFLYYLTKKILKQQIMLEQMHRLAALYMSCPEECCDGLRRFWPEETVRLMVAALLRHDAGWIRTRRAKLLSGLRASNPVESWWKRVQQHGREWRRKIERVTCPVGLSLSVIGGTAEQRDELARALEENLRPAFRRTTIRDEATDGGSMGSAAGDCLAKVRSTLVIRKRETEAKEGFVRDEIGFVLPRHRNVERATRVTLEYLAARLQRRIRPGRASLSNIRRAR